MIIHWKPKATQRYSGISGVIGGVYGVALATVGTTSDAVSTLIAMERASFTRLFSRIFGRVN